MNIKKHAYIAIIIENQRLLDSDWTIQGIERHYRELFQALFSTESKTLSQTISSAIQGIERHYRRLFQTLFRTESKGCCHLNSESNTIPQVHNRLPSLAIAQKVPNI